MPRFRLLSTAGRALARGARGSALAAGALLAASGCLSQSYEVSAPELARLVERPPAERGERVRVTQQTSFGNDLRDTTLPASDADVALLLAGSVDSPGPLGQRRRSVELDADVDSLTEDALATAVVVVATAATAAVTLGVTEGARFDGWVRAPEQHPVLLVDRRGQRRWKRLGLLAPADLRDVDHAVLADFSDDLDRLERHPLQRTGFVYQLELGAEPAPLEGAALAFAGRGGLGYMPSQRYGVLLGAAFSSARAAGSDAASDATTLSFDHRVFLQAEAWSLSAGRWHLGPYAELGYA